MTLQSTALTSPELMTASVRDGANIRYRVLAGEGTARFALVHSLAMDNRFWERAAQHLLKAGDVLLFDCRGHGLSSKTSSPFTAEQFADDLADLLDVVGWKTAIVAGASMGGCVSLSFAAAYPKRTSGLGLVDTTASYGALAPEQWEERAQKALSSGMAALAEFQKSRWFSKDFAAANPSLVKETVDIFLTNDIPSYAETCRMLGRFDKTGALSRITAPTRVIVGSEDYATPPSMAQVLRDGIPGATLTVLDGAAHLTPLERSQDVARVLIALSEVTR